MAKWARVNPNENSPILEVITYDPEGVINENFLPLFKSCPDEVEKGYFYNSETDEFYLPDGYAKHPDFESFGYVLIPEGGTVDDDGFLVLPPAPKQITESDVRTQLTLTEKILWDTPETGTTQQKALIESIKLDFPYDASSIVEPVNLLEQFKIIGTGRSNEIITALS